MPSIIIVGAGPMGRWHMDTARRLGARLVGVADRDLAAAERLARRGGGAVAERDPVALARRVRPDIAHVCTPMASHHGIACDLLAEGVDVLVEKPFAATVAEVADIIDRAASAGRQVCPVHQYAFQPGMERAVAMLPRLGAVERIAFEICTAGAAGAYARRPGAVVREILPHPLSMLQRLLPGVDVGAVDWQVRRPAAGSVAVAGVAAGTVIDIWISTVAHPTRFAATVHAARGTVEINGFHGYMLEVGGRPTRTAKLAAPFVHAAREFGAASANLIARAVRREPAYPGLRTLTARFYAAAAGRGAPPVGTAELLSGARAYDRIAAQLAA